MYLLVLLLLVVLICIHGNSNGYAALNQVQLFSRQLPVYGVTGQLKLQQSKVILTGNHMSSMKEVVKNLILSGVRHIDILSTPVSTTSGRASPNQLQLEQEEASQNQREWWLFVGELNPQVKLNFVRSLDKVPRQLHSNPTRLTGLEQKPASDYDVCVTCDGDNKHITFANDLCRNVHVGTGDSCSSLKHVVCNVQGLCGSVFVDYGDAAAVEGTRLGHESYASQLGFIDKPHDSAAPRLPGLPEAEVSLRTFHPTLLPVNSAENSNLAVSRTRALFLALQWRGPGAVSGFNASISTVGSIGGMSRRQRNRLLLRKFKLHLVRNMAAWRESNHGYGPVAADREHILENKEAFTNVDVFNKMYQQYWKRLSSSDRRAVREVCRYWLKNASGGRAHSPAAGAVLAAVASNEAIKSILNGNSKPSKSANYVKPASVEYPPLNQWFLFESLDNLAGGALDVAKPAASFGSGGGSGLLGGLKVVVVGAGAIGCEVLNVLSNLHTDRKADLDKCTSDRVCTTARSHWNRRLRTNRQATSTATAHSVNGGTTFPTFPHSAAKHNIPMPRRVPFGLYGGEQVDAESFRRPVRSSTAVKPGPHITVIDMDRIELSNLNRQLLFAEGDIGKFKANAAAARINAKFDALLSEGRRHGGGGAMVSSIVGQVTPALVSLDRKLYARVIDDEYDEEEEEEFAGFGEDDMEFGGEAAVGSPVAKATQAAHGGTKFPGNDTDLRVLEAIRGADIVVSAVDNIETRAVLDSLCKRYGKWLIDGGTSGLLGSTQTIIPFIGESYNGNGPVELESPSQPEDDGNGVDDSLGSDGQVQDQDIDQDLIPVCSIKSTPTKPIHCILWAKQQFDELFSEDIASFNSFAHGDKGGGAGAGADLSSINLAKYGYLLQIQKLVGELSVRKGQLSRVVLARHDQIARQQMMRLCLSYGLEVFEELFGPSLARPAGTTTGFSPSNTYHRRFAVQFAKILHDQAVFAGSKVGVGEAVRPVEWQEALDLLYKRADSSGSARIRSSTQLAEHLRRQQGGKNLLSVVQYKNDKPEYGHVDLLTTAANIRAQCFNIQSSRTELDSEGEGKEGVVCGIDSIQVQQVAGRVIPAVVTTTSLVSGLMTLELLKAAQFTRRAKEYVEQVENRFRKSRQNLLRAAPAAASTKKLSILSYLSSLRQKWGSFRETKVKPTLATAPVGSLESTGAEMKFTESQRLKFTHQFYHYHRHQLATTGRNYYVNLLSRTGTSSDELGVNSGDGNESPAGMELLYAIPPLRSTD